MRKVLLSLFALVFVFGAAPAFAQECVEVDVELPASVVAEPGAFAEGYFELVNCGDEAAMVTLDVSIEIAGVPPFEIGGIMVPLGAGEVVSREFAVPVPPNAGGNEVTICLDAVIGEASASDCATMVIEEGGAVADGSSKTTGFLAAADGDCVDVMLELPDSVYVEEGASIEEGYFELTNCGDEAALVELEVAFQLMDTTITVGFRTVPLGAGESVSREFTFPVPPIVPAGEYGVCVTAYAGEAMATSCQTVIVVNDTNPWDDGGGLSANNYPNPFNPATTISFTLPTAEHVNVSVYNSLGQEVEVLHDGQLTAGSHSIEWDGSDAASGMYFYRIEAGDDVVSKKMVLVK